MGDAAVNLLMNKLYTKYKASNWMKLNLSRVVVARRVSRDG